MKKLLMSCMVSSLLLLSLGVVFAQVSKSSKQNVKAPAKQSSGGTVFDGIGNAAIVKAPPLVDQVRNGRYQIVFSPHVRAETFMLDTQTGKVWRLTEITDAEGKPDIWRNMDRIDSLDEYYSWSKKVLDDMRSKENKKLPDSFIPDDGKMEDAK